MMTLEFDLKNGIDHALASLQREYPDLLEKESVENTRNMAYEKAKSLVDFIDEVYRNAIAQRAVSKAEPILEGIL